MPKAGQKKGGRVRAELTDALKAKIKTFLNANKDLAYSKIMKAAAKEGFSSSHVKAVRKEVGFRTKDTWAAASGKVKKEKKAKVTKKAPAAKPKAATKAKVTKKAGGGKKRPAAKKAGGGKKKGKAAPVTAPATAAPKETKPAGPQETKPAAPAATTSTAPAAATTQVGSAG